MKIRTIRAKTYIYGISLAVMFTTALPYAYAASSTSKPVMHWVQYHGIRPTDPDGREGLHNPGRGFRMQINNFAKAPLTVPYGWTGRLHDRIPHSYYDNAWRLMADQYKADGISVALLYIQIPQKRTPQGRLTEEWLNRLQNSFNMLKHAGLEAIPCFTYRMHSNDPTGPSLKTRIADIHQLTPFFQKNQGLIYAMWAGFIGIWGEWHSDPVIPLTDIDGQAKIVNALLHALPKDRMILIRYPRGIKTLLDKLLGSGKHPIDSQTAHNGTPASRLGMYNAGFLSTPDSGGTYPSLGRFFKNGKQAFEYIEKRSPYLIIGGEMYVKRAGSSMPVNGFKAAKRMFTMHYSTFSIAHSYSVREGKPYSIDIWRTTPISPIRLHADHMPFDPVYFEDIYGNPVERTVFEYIRDHLGYRLELKTAHLPKSASSSEIAKATIYFYNRGFAAIQNPRPVYITLVDVAGSGKVWSFKCKNAKPQNWQPYKPGDSSYKPLLHHITCNFKIPSDIPPGEYSIGLWLPDASKQLRKNPDYSIQFANGDITWWINLKHQYGINLISTIKIK